MCRLPETSAGVTDKAEIYALGCLLVEMCTGEPWAAGVLTLKVFSPGRSAESPLVHIIQSCLCINPDGRPTATKIQQVWTLCLKFALH